MNKGLKCAEIIVDEINLEDNRDNRENKNPLEDKGMYIRGYLNSILDEYKKTLEFSFGQNNIRPNKTSPGMPLYAINGDKTNHIAFTASIIQMHGIPFLFNMAKIYIPFIIGCTEYKNPYHKDIIEYIKNHFVSEDKNFWDKNFVNFLEKKKTNPKNDTFFSNQSIFWNFVYKFAPEIILKFHRKNFGNNYTNSDIFKRFLNNFSDENVGIYPFQNTIKDFENGSIYGITNKLSKENWIKFFKNYNAEQNLYLGNGKTISFTSDFRHLLNGNKFEFCDDKTIFDLVKNSVTRDKKILLSIPDKKWNAIIHNKRTSRRTVESVLFLLLFVGYDMENIKMFKTLEPRKPYEIEKYMRIGIETTNTDYISVFENIRKNESNEWNKIIDDINKTTVFNLLDDETISFEIVEYFYDYIKNKKRYIHKFPKILLSEKYGNNIEILKNI